jgi:hypothetical protein
MKKCSSPGGRVNYACEWLNSPFCTVNEDKIGRLIPVKVSNKPINRLKIMYKFKKAPKGFLLSLMKTNR